MPGTTDWYFDFISPFAYLQQKHLQKQFPAGSLQAQPLLFAGLLNHWGHKGPAEIPAKRIFTYQHVVWLGRHLGIPLQTPPSHPFNPLRPLRLAIALENDMDMIGHIFDYIWRDGLSVENDADWTAFTRELGIHDADSRLEQQWVKDKLRKNTEDAIAAGVFGVPSLVCDGHLFWGQDATEMFYDYQQNPELFDSEEMQRINLLQATAQRQ